MTKVLVAIALAVMTLFIGLRFFPDIHTALSSTDTTGFSYMLTAAVTFLPYILVLVIIYAVFKAVKGGR